MVPENAAMPAIVTSTSAGLSPESTAVLDSSRFGSTRTFSGPGSPERARFLFWRLSMLYDCFVSGVLLKRNEKTMSDIRRFGIRERTDLVEL